MLPGSWLINLGNGAICETQCWCLLLVYWTFSHSHCQVDFGEWKSMLPSLCITYIAANMATSYVSQPGNCMGCWGKRLPRNHKTGHHSVTLLKSSLVEISHWWTFTRHTNNFTFFAHSEASIQKLFSKFPCHQFSNYVFFMSLTIQPNHWLKPMNWHIIAHLILSPSKNKKDIIWQ